MTIKSSGNPLAFSEIEAEFGADGVRRLGKYRTTDPDFSNESPSGSSLSNLPLDNGIPTSGTIKFSDFYSKKLNMVVDYYGDVANLNKQAAGANTMAATWRYQNQTERVKVVGGFRSRPIGSVAGGNYVLSASDWQGGKKIMVNVNQTVGGRKPSLNDVALRTGIWPSGTELQIDIGPSGYLTGAGGDGGRGGSNNGNDVQPGNNGSSALGIEYAATVNNNGVIRCGYGGGGGGSGAANDPSDKSDTDFGRSGGGGGGGAGLPAGIGGAENTAGFSDYDPNTEKGFAGGNGTLTAGGQGGAANNEGGADAGEGGNGGDINDAPQSGVKGVQGRPGVGYSAPVDPGPAGPDGKAIIFSNATVENNSTLNGNTVGGRNGGIGGGLFT